MQNLMNEINYDKLIEKALKNVVVEALKIAQVYGLPGENHFYITFKTNYSTTQISAQLKKQYPEEMTIILQHQYSNLKVSEDFFEVDLSFGGILQTLKIAFDSIIYFADPHAKFGLSFESITSKETRNKEATGETKKVSNGFAEVVSIDAFRKK